MQKRLVFYYKKSCEECFDVEAILGSVISDYERWHITASPTPGLILLHDESGVVHERLESEIPAVPALWDSSANVLLIGRRAILGYIA